MKKTVIDASSDTWEITVTYDVDANIPDEAELKVREILPEDANREAYEKAFRLYSMIYPALKEVFRSGACAEPANR